MNQPGKTRSLSAMVLSAMVPSAIGLSGVALATACGCQPVGNAALFRSYVKSMPPDRRPKDWEHTLELMDRPVPKVGNVAPDFTLESYHGQQAMTRSALQGDRPQVLIFGSYT